MKSPVTSPCSIVYTFLLNLTLEHFSIQFVDPLVQARLSRQTVSAKGAGTVTFACHLFQCPGQWWGIPSGQEEVGEFYTMAYYSAIKKNETMPFAVTLDYHTKQSKPAKERQICYHFYVESK